MCWELLSGVMVWVWRDLCLMLCWDSHHRRSLFTVGSRTINTTIRWYGSLVWFKQADIFKWQTFSPSLNNLGNDIFVGVSDPKLSNVRKCESTVTCLSPIIWLFEISTRIISWPDCEAQKIYVLECDNVLNINLFDNVEPWAIPVISPRIHFKHSLFIGFCAFFPQETGHRNHPISPALPNHPRHIPASSSTFFLQIEWLFVTSDCSKGYSTTPESFIASHETPSSWSKTFAPWLKNVTGVFGGCNLIKLWRPTEAP